MLIVFLRRMHQFFSLQLDLNRLTWSYPTKKANCQSDAIISNLGCLIMLFSCSCSCCSSYQNLPNNIPDYQTSFFYSWSLSTTPSDQSKKNDNLMTSLLLWDLMFSLTHSVRWGFLRRWEYQTTLSASWEICMQVK